MPQFKPQGPSLSLKFCMVKQVNTFVFQPIETIIVENEISIIHEIYLKCLKCT